MCLTGVDDVTYTKHRKVRRPRLCFRVLVYQGTETDAHPMLNLPVFVLNLRHLSAVLDTYSKINTVPNR